MLTLISQNEFAEVVVWQNEQNYSYVVTFQLETTEMQKNGNILCHLYLPIIQEKCGLEWKNSTNKN